MGRFLALFHRYGWIYKLFDGEHWLSADETWALTDSEILKAIACVHPRQFLGTRADKATRFGVLDIDAGSKYHTAKQLARIVEILAQAGIAETSLFRSSNSGGWHLYLFFDEPVSSRDLRAQLIQLLTLNGFEVGRGVLEIFPAPGEGPRTKKSLGNGLRLPLQPGFAWLNHAGQVIEERNEISPAEALDRFVRDIDCCNSRHDFHQMKAHVARLTESQEQITAQVSQINKREGVVVPFKRPSWVETDEYAQNIVFEVFQSLPPGINVSSWVSGRDFAQVGLTGKSQRAEATFSLSHYLFYGDPELALPPLGYGYEQERNWAIDEILKNRHNGFSKDINNGRSDAFAQAERAANWLPPHRRGGELVPFVKRVPIAWQRNSANLKSQAAKKIQAAVADFEEAGMTFSVRDLQLKTGCSNRTLYRHEQLWKPAQAHLQNLRLATVTPEYNVVVGAVPSETSALPQSTQKIMPTGLLAARRIIHEIKMRATRDKLDRQNMRRRGWKEIDNSWRKELEKITPASFAECDTKNLRATLAVYLSAVPRSPDHESEGWICGLIAELRVELENRPKQLELVFSKSQKISAPGFAHLESEKSG